MKSGKDQETCLKKLENIPKNAFSIHGLWPGLKSGEYLSDCQGKLTKDDIEAVASSTEKEFYENYMKKYWVSFKDNDIEFWLHEYNKHGLCYTNRKKQSNFTQYFKDTMNFFINNDFPNILKNTFPYVTDPDSTTIGESIVISVTKQDMDIIIKSFFPGAFYKINCELKNKVPGYLTEIYFYYDEDFKPYNVPFAISDNCGGELDDIKLVFKK